MPSDSYEDVFKNLARAMEDVLNNLSLDDARFVGCTIITGTGDDPRILNIDDVEKDNIVYEMMESPENIFITAEIPPTTSTAPYAAIQTDSVIIHADDCELVINLPCSINIARSCYAVQNGIMDIVCYKL